jgi:hypothetical protein
MPCQSTCLHVISLELPYTAINHRCTSTDDLLFGPPLAQHGEQESKRIGDGHGQTEFSLSD